MRKNNITKLVTASLLAALTCIATMVIQVPSPMNGYVHLGDAFVILSGVILGPLYGSAAAGIGSMFADILTGYTHYALGTLLIKALAACVASILYYAITNHIKTKTSQYIGTILGGLGSGVIVTIGYFIFSSIFLDKGIAAISSIPGNIIQTVFGLIIATILVPILMKIPNIRFMSYCSNKL